MCGSSSAPIPIPESLIVIATCEFTRCSCTCTRPPFGVNFTALLSRFHTTCWKRSGSPPTGPTGEVGTDCSRMFLAAAAGRMPSIASSITSRTSTGWTVRRILPASMRETSSRSSIRRTWAVTFRRMICSARRVCSASRSPRWRMVAQPFTALSGVRSSCERVDRNWSLARLAASARSRSAGPYRRPDSVIARVMAPSTCSRALMGTTIHDVRPS